MMISNLGSLLILLQQLQEMLYPEQAHPLMATPTKDIQLSNPKAFDACPVDCESARLSSKQWSSYHTLERLTICDKEMLLDFNIFNNLNDSSLHKSIFACTANGTYASAPSIGSPHLTSSDMKNRKMNHTNMAVEISWVDSDSPQSLTGLQSMMEHLILYISSQDNDSDSIVFVKLGKTAIGIFAGSQIHSQGIDVSTLREFENKIHDMNTKKSIIAQLCGNGRSSRYSLGIVLSMTGDIALLQEAAKTWKIGACLPSNGDSAAWISVNVSMSEQTAVNSTAHPQHNNTTKSTTSKRDSIIRSDCTTTTVASGDTCSSLAAECGISPADFTNYNPSSSLCSSLAAGQHVCCSSGTLPDFAPQPNLNGTCATYFVETSDSCNELAATNSLSIEQLENYPNDTWGWMGCSDLQAGQNICLSSGSPPMLAPINNAICGPQVPGTPPCAIRYRSYEIKPIYTKCVL